jgi:hypothetical protein
MSVCKMFKSFSAGATGGLSASIPAAELLRRTLQGIFATIPGAFRLPGQAGILSGGEDNLEGYITLKVV